MRRSLIHVEIGPKATVALDLGRPGGVATRGRPPIRLGAPRPPLRTHMIEPYQAIGLVPTIWGIRRREDIQRSLEHLDHLVTASAWLGGLDLPVRLIAIPEGALQGFNDEVLDLDHATFARECAIDIPGPETDELGRPRPQMGCVRDGPGQGATSRVPRQVLQRRLRAEPRRRGRAAPPQGGAAPARWSTRSRRTTSTTAGSSCTAPRSTPSIPWPTPRSGGSGS